MLFLVPMVAPSVYVSDLIDSSTLSISWTAIPEEHVMGRLLGYHVMYTPVKKADKPLKENAGVTTVTVDYPGYLLTRLKGLESFTSYIIRVAGFTSKGDGIASSRVTGGKIKLRLYNISNQCQITNDITMW